MGINSFMEKLIKLNNSAALLGKVLDPESLYEIILDQLKEIFKISSGAILLFDKDGETLRIKAARGYDEKVIAEFSGRKGVGITGLALERKEAVFIEDVRKSPHYIEGLKGAVAELAAPLIVNGNVIGVLDIESNDKEAFRELDFQLFKTFVSIAASSIKSALFFQKAKEKALRLAAINEVGSLISLEYDLDSLIRKVIESLQSALSVSYCAVLVVDDEGSENVMKVKASVGYNNVESLKIKFGEGITGKAAQMGKPLLVRDVTKHPDYIRGIKDGKCEMCAPMKVKGKVIGVIDVESKIAGAFDEEDLELLNIFASQVASAMHNAKLINQLESANLRLAENLKEMESLNVTLDSYARQLSSTNRALEKQIKQLMTLHRAGLTITSSLDLDTTLRRIIEMTSDLVETSAATIKLLDKESQQMQVKIERIGKTPGGMESKVDLPLKIGDKTIGVFELASTREMGEEEKRLLETLATQAAIAIENARLFEETQKTYYATLKSLATALEARDAYTRGHSERVAKLSLKMAKKLGLSEEESKEIFSVALLHDIGKIGVRDEILHKPQSLTEEEWKAIKEHPLFGDAILTPLRFLSKVAGMVKHHHERWDGTGYPQGLKGEAIPLASRIVSVADAFDALTSDRPYRERKSTEEAIKIISSESGKQFDPKVVEALLVCLEEEPTAP